MRFSSEPVLITGGSGGMGAAMARRLASSGARVVVCDLDQDAVQRVTGELTDAGHEALGVSADTCDEQQMLAAVDQAEQAFGPLYGLVTAAGIRQPAAPFHQIDLDTWDRVHRVNVMGTLIAIRACRPHLVRTHGAIVTVASVTANAARMNQSAYCVSKAAVLHLTRQVALELAADGVRANALCPGVTRTPMIEEAVRTDGPQVLEDKLRGSLEAFRPGIPLGRLSEPEEQAATAEFLLSPDASFITGAAIYVDGGVSMLG
ncbi:SDR family NAD(P)-dependent oxidoreductase [Serinicoccus kebangsaanensis]|uniref:SDR family NAD(P)-dependent oxidoreductase n=1 Tax=Serinicoccus kebangsaanensis TaxID=2602069 RepID=UPI00124E4EEF|nr:SDR family NAD(P)-dependent oxidoreductase [Serinicoccus kebangsaanensis]